MKCPTAAPCSLAWGKGHTRKRITTAQQPAENGDLSLLSVYPIGKEEILYRGVMMLLTVELKDGPKTSEAEAAICFDEEGLEFLIEKLVRLRGKNGHEHLMTPAWAGNELSEDKQGGEEYELVNHLRLVKSRK